MCFCLVGKHSNFSKDLREYWKNNWIDDRAFSGATKTRIFIFFSVMFSLRNRCSPLNSMLSAQAWTMAIWLELTAKQMVKIWHFHRQPLTIHTDHTILSETTLSIQSLNRYGLTNKGRSRWKTRFDWYKTPTNVLCIEENLSTVTTYPELNSEKRKNPQHFFSIVVKWNTSH